MLPGDALAPVRSGALRESGTQARAWRGRTFLSAAFLAFGATLLATAADAAPPPPGARPPGAFYGRPPGAYRPPGHYARPYPPAYYPRPYPPAYYGPRVGVYVGPGWGYYGGWGYGGWGGYWGWPGWGWAPPPVVVTPAPIVVPANPPVYVERGDVAPQSGTLEPGYWYYCHGPAGYYPNVTDCPGGWEKVAPLPQNTQ